MNTIAKKPYIRPQIKTMPLSRTLVHHLPNITRKTIEFREVVTLSPFAWPSVKSLGRLVPEKGDDIRTIYARDNDRIEYTRGYQALDGKTQFYTFPKSPHIHDRLFHVNKVGRVGRTIGRYLGLNEDLIEAQSKGHDVGHTPFGHEGEKALSAISLKVLGKPFKHNLHSLRVLDILEEKNLSAEVRNGIVCHCGETVDYIYAPGKLPKDLVNLTDEDMPYTLEGCVVRISDQIAYLSHDLADALRLKIVTTDDLPPIVKEVLGRDPDRMIGLMIMDVIEASRGKNHITMSQRMFEAREAFFEFEKNKIIASEKVQSSRRAVPEIMETLFRFNTEIKGIDPQSAIDKIASYTDKQAKDRFNAIKRQHGVMRI
jgi:dGTPase